HPLLLTAHAAETPGDLCVFLCLSVADPDSVSSAHPCRSWSCKRSCSSCRAGGQSLWLATALAVTPLMKVTTDLSTCSRAAVGSCGQCGQPSARQRSKSRMYSRCTQALMRRRRLSVET